jgi:hypothetical protein
MFSVQPVIDRVAADLDKAPAMYPLRGSGFSSYDMDYRFFARIQTCCQEPPELTYF